MKFVLLASFSFLLLFTSCSKNDVDINEFTDDTLYLIETETRSGQMGCYELVYPVDLVFPDGSTLEVNDLEALKAAVKDWRLNNQDVNGRPHLAFPYEILTEDGELITVENRQQKLRLRMKCKAEMGEGPHPHLGKPCFRISYPITIEFPGGNTVELESRRALKMALRRWKKENPDVEERPHIVYPIEVMFEDGSTQVINDRDELRRLKLDCRGK